MSLGETTVYLGIPLTNGYYSNEKFLTATSNMQTKAKLNGIIERPDGKWHLKVYVEGEPTTPIVDQVVQTGERFDGEKKITINSNKLVVCAEVTGSNEENTVLEGTITINVGV